MKATDVALFVDPFSRRNERGRLFDRNSMPDAGHDALAPFAHLQEWFQQRGVAVHTADVLDGNLRNGRRVNVYISLGGRQRYTNLARRADVCLSAFFAFECPVVLPALYGELHKIGQTFKRVYSFSSSESLHSFLRGPVDLDHFMLPQSFEDVHQEIWERRDRKFLVMVSGNKLTSVPLNELYTERLRALEYFHRFGEIDLYGRDWDGPPIHMATWMPRPVARLDTRLRKRWRAVRPSKEPRWIAVRETYRGPTTRKDLTLGGYRFAICFENSVLEGWITEKIFDCFYAGTIPVYLGAPDIEDWIPPACYVDMRKFGDYDELREFLVSRTPEQIEAYRLAARDFLRSERFRPFSKQTFTERIARIVEEDTGVSL